VAFVAAQQDVSTADGCRVVGEAHERALRELSDDIQSTPLWLSYIELVRTGDKTMEETRRMTALRGLYQRAISTPLIDIERIWKQYDAFENKLNKQLAKPLLLEFSARYMAARGVRVVLSNACVPTTTHAFSVRAS
jgi:cleavage stimulation factor subunit 3